MYTHIFLHAVIEVHLACNDGIYYKKNIACKNGCCRVISIIVSGSFDNCHWGIHICNILWVYCGMNSVFVFLKASSIFCAQGPVNQNIHSSHHITLTEVCEIFLKTTPLSSFLNCFCWILYLENMTSFKAGGLWKVLALANLLVKLVHTEEDTEGRQTYKSSSHSSILW